MSKLTFSSTTSSQVSRLVRQEALPVFFNLPRRIDIVTNFVHDYKFYRGENLPRTAIFRDPTRIMTMPSHLFQHIRNLTLVPHFMYTGKARVAWNIELQPGANRLSRRPLNEDESDIKDDERNPWTIVPAKVDSDNVEIERGLTAILDRVFSRGNKSFNLPDMDKILAAFDRGWAIAWLS